MLLSSPNHDNLEVARANIYPTCMSFAIIFLETGIWVKCVLRGFKPHTVNLRAVSLRLDVCLSQDFLRSNCICVPAAGRFFSRNEGLGLPL